MHFSDLAITRPDKPACIMAGSGQRLSFRELNQLSIQASQLFRHLGLGRGEHLAILMENQLAYLPICFAAQRSGLYFTTISHQLQVDEVDYILRDSQAKLFITSMAQRPVAEQLQPRLGKEVRALMLDGVIPGYEAWETALRRMPAVPIADESMGMPMLYSSGTTGRPKGILKPLPEEALGENTRFAVFQWLYGATEDSVYLCPAPLYHAAPLNFTMVFMAAGMTCIVMEHFEAEAALKTIETYGVTHSQWVPTMFIRMLKLDEQRRLRYDLSSLECAIHAAAPCPIPIKEQMIDWWGAVIHEYYAGSEGNGFVAINTEDWLSHKGSVGQPLNGQLHILNEAGAEVKSGEIGTIYFSGGDEFEYFNDPEKTQESRHPAGWSTLGDLGYVDEEGYLYLTDRKSYMIISGGVNIYPQEAENLLVTHPRVMDVAVFGVPNEEFGEEVKAVVQPKDWAEAGPALAAELIGFCRLHLAHIKCPRSVDFAPELPRHPTGKLYKRLLRDSYWEGV